MRTFNIMLSYDGTDFGGFQRQSNARSVQQVLEEALAPIEGADVIVSGAGRTDAGVHALGQVASCALSGPISPDDLKKALNATLSATGSNDVRVLAVEEAAEDFSPFDWRYGWHVPRALNLDHMRDAACALVGERDFAAFQSAGNKVTTS